MGLAADFEKLSVNDSPAIVSSMKKFFGNTEEENDKKTAAMKVASLVKETKDSKFVASLCKEVIAALSGNADSKINACVAIVALSQVASVKVEAYFVPVIVTLLDMYADKSMPVRASAKDAATAVTSNCNRHAVRLLLPLLYQAMERSKKWQTKLGALEIVQALADRCTIQIIAGLMDMIPPVADCMHDTRAEVKSAATATMEKICVGNKDIEPFIPALISSLAKPEEVPECVHKLASTTFVKTVDAPTLAIMLPLLIRGLTTNKISIMRQTAVIIDNMCKLVEEPREAELFLPKLLPGLEKVIDTAADKECREVATRAHHTLKLAGGEGDDDIRPKKRVAFETVQEIVKKVTSSVGMDEGLVAYITQLSNDLVLSDCHTQQTWKDTLKHFFVFAPKGEALINEIREKCVKENMDDVDTDSTEDPATILCDCEFSLAYGGMILLNNTRLKLKRGHRYGLCGPNGCGKSTLMRAINNGQLEGFPSKDELKTVFVEHSLQATEAELSVLEFIMADETLQGVARAEVVTTLAGVGFNDAMQAQAVGSLSGGWKMKLELARAMLMHADILLLDEPTNHLDVANVAWLTNYLTSLTNVTSLIVSHDSGFLDNVCSDIIHYENRKLKSYKGNLSEFVKVKPEAMAYYELSEAAFSFKFPAPGFLDNIKTKGKRIIKMENVSFTYPGGTKPIISNVNVAAALSSRVGVLGPNGAGKSTLIKMMTGETEPTSGIVTKHPNLRFAYVAQHAFHHIEDHLDSTPNQYVQWRFQSGADKELMAKVSRQMSPEDIEQMKKVLNIDGEKRVIETLVSRRKMKKSFEYEVKWVNMPDEDKEWISRDRLERWGYDKLLQITDDREAQKANLTLRPLTAGVIQKHYEEFGLGPEFSTHSRIRGLSGGQKVKVVLGAAMWLNPHMIVLDEPTNYLDRDSLGALAAAIKEFEGGVVVISHNAEFVNAVCTEIWKVGGGVVQVEGETAVDKDTTKIEQKTEEESMDAFGNVVKTKIKRKLNRKELKQRQKEKKEALARGEEWSTDEDE